MTIATRRKTIYWSICLLLLLSYWLLRDITWRSDAEVHIFMEGMAALLAAVIGSMALVRFKTQPTNILLLLGAGFLGVAFLDGFHATTTLRYFQPLSSMHESTLLTWSWIAARQFLAVLMFISLLAVKRERDLGDKGLLPEKYVYITIIAVILLCFVFLVLAPLTRAYDPEYLVSRPEEFGPALFFILALVGYYRMGEWQTDVFKHWLMLFLIISVVSELVIMPLSSSLFDFEFDLAHLLKIVSYLLVLVGLTVNMYSTFVREVQSTERMRAVVDHIFDGIITIDSRGVIRSINKAVTAIFAYDEEELLGQNVSMLAASPHQENHDTYLKNYLATGQAKIIGIGREVRGRRKSGAEFPMELQIAELWAFQRRMFLGVVRDISERHEADRMKSEFISTVSHELRTPLTAIRGSLGMLGSGAISDPDKSQQMLQLATRNTERLIELVNDLLDMEKIQLGKMDFTFQRLDLIDVAAKAVEVNQPYATERGVILVYSNGLETAPVMGDLLRINQVLSNLISNAAKFSPQGETVEITVSKIQDLFRVSVVDHGSGISEDFRDKLFERFTQADASDTRKQGGTGLGLNISKMIVEKHGGQIGFESEINRGSTFYFDLLEAPEAEEGGQNLQDNQNRIDRRARKRRILVLEDDKESARLISRILQQKDYLIDVVYTTDDAKHCLQQDQYDAMTVNILLSDEELLNLIRDIREQSITRDMPILVVSVTQEEAIVCGSDLGIIDWLQKPIAPERLLNAIQGATRNTKRIRILYVEDDKDLVGVLSSMLSDSIEVVPARNLATAKAILGRESFDLLILDVGLPDGSGLELLPLLRKDGHEDTPVIVYSASELAQDIRQQVAEALVKSRTSNEDLISVIQNLVTNEFEHGG